MRAQIWAVLLGCLTALAGCKGKQWIEGEWVPLSEEGKLGMCHEFKKDGTFTVYTGVECSNSSDPFLSGKWEFKGDEKLAIQRGNELKAQLVLIAERKEDHFVVRGAFSGTMYRVGPKGGRDLVAQLESKGLIKIKVLPAGQGCKQFSLPIKEIKALPIEAEPRMIRVKDKALEYRVNRSTSDPKIEKVVYALNQDVIEWVALHLTPEAFDPPGPQERLAGSLGQPIDTVATGQGETRQHIAMWHGYCAQLRDAPNKDIDVTLFATTGERRGTIYISENVVANQWEDLKQLAKDPAAQVSEEAEAEEEQTEETSSTNDDQAALSTKRASPASGKALPKVGKLSRNPASAVPPEVKAPAPSGKSSPTPLKPTPSPDDDL